MTAKNAPRALIVDDEPDIRELLEITLGRMNVETLAAESLERAFELLDDNDFDLCLTDMHLPDGNGIDLVKRIGSDYPSLPVAMITAFGSMDTAVDALKAGAFDFVQKPVDLEQLRRLVETALKVDASESAEQAATRLTGSSKVMANLRDMITKLARSQAPVYISGESGTGKEVAARLIHEQGPRADAAFVPVNCGAIPSELMEKRVLRPPQRQLHRRRHRQAGALSGSFRRHAVSRRSRRFAAGNAGQAAARYPGESRTRGRCPVRREH